MSAESPTGAPGASAEGEVIDLRYIAHSIWLHRKLVVALILLGGLAGLLGSYLNTKYYAQGLLLVPDISVEDFKRYQVAFLNEPRLRKFLELTQTPESPAREQLLKLMRDQAELTDAMRPEFAYTDRDAKQFSVRFDEPGQLVGVSFRLRHRDLATANPVILMSEYFRDTMITVDLNIELYRHCAEYETREQELRNETLETDFRISQHRLKADLLRGVVSKNPEAVRLDTRQVISVREGNERYLSPLAQLVGEETAVADLEVRQVQRKRDTELARLKKIYYCSGRDLLATPMTGKALIEALDTVNEKMFEGLDMNDALNERANNDLQIERERWGNKFLVRTRFVAPPEGASVRVRTPGPFVGTVLGLILGGLGGILLATAASWWNYNRGSITAAD